MKIGIKLLKSNDSAINKHGRRALSEVYSNFAFDFNQNKKYYEAEKMALKALCYTDTNDYEGLIIIYSHLESVFDKLAIPSKKIYYALKQLEFIERNSDSKTRTLSLINAGTTLINYGEYEKALKLYRKASINRRQLPKDGLFTFYVGILANNLISIQEQKLYLKELETYIQQSELNDNQLRIVINIYLKQSLIDKAKIYLSKLKVKNNSYYRYLALIQFEEKKYDAALQSLNQINKDEIKSSVENLNLTYRIYEKKGDAKEALKYYILYQKAKDKSDSLNSKQFFKQQQQLYLYNNKSIADSLKNVQAAKLASAQLQLSQTKLKQQQIIRYVLYSGIVLVLLFLAIVYNRFKKTQEQKNSIEAQKHLIEEKQKEIIDSINYAKKIQEALLKEQEHVSPHLPAHFILYKPKDIIAGDFYWGVEKQDWWYVAVADCTGHGVPGAMMSMLGIAYLNEIIAHDKYVNPAQILDDLRTRIIKELNQTNKEGENKDGMDISLLAINLKTKQCEWAGANNPLWIIRNKETIKINADKQPIGLYPTMKPFTNNAIQLQENDSLYLFTDGYADQFGGAQSKKFKYKQLQELLLQNSELSLAQQNDILNKEFEKWKGELEQVDDVCIIGIRV